MVSPKSNTLAKITSTPLSRRNKVKILSSKPDKKFYSNKTIGQSK